MTLSEAARAYLGVPFRHQGRNPAVGLDCVGLLVVAGCAIGLPVELHDCHNYGRDPSDGLLDRHLASAFGAPVATMLRDDVVSIHYAGPARHVGIVGQVGDRLTLIHTSQGLGKVVEHGIDAKWLGRVHRIYRPGVSA